MLNQNIELLCYYKSYVQLFMQQLFLTHPNSLEVDSSINVCLHGILRKFLGHVRTEELETHVDIK